MKQINSFTFFRRYLFSKNANSVVRRVSIICFFGLVISIGSLLIVFNVMGGLGQSIKENFLKTQPHLILSFDKKFSNKFIQEQKVKIKSTLKSNGLEAGLSELYFYEDVDVLIRTAEGNFTGAVAKGYEPAHLKLFMERMLAEDAGADMFESTGQVLEGEAVVQQVEEEGQKASATKDIIMGLGLAQELNLYEEEQVQLIPAENLLLPPGEPIQFESVNVSSLISTQNSSWNASHIFYDRSEYPSFRNSSSYTYGFEIRLHKPEDFLPYKLALEQRGFTVEAWSERNSSVFFALKVEKLIMSLFLSLAGLITLLAVSSLLVLLIIQKKKEIGILMAMGMDARKVQKIFVGVGLFLCFFGLLGSAILSLLVSLLLKYQDATFISQFNAGSNLPVEFNLVFMLGLFLAVFLLACISCFLSVRSQSNLLPAELLKTVEG